MQALNGRSEAGSEEKDTLRKRVAEGKGGVGKVRSLLTKLGSWAVHLREMLGSVIG